MIKSNILRGAMPAIAAAFLLSSCGGQSAKVASSCGVDPDEQQLLIGDDIAVAQTRYGAVRGYVLRHVYTFLGVPYGASTAGENRFMPPKDPQPWKDTLETIYYGSVSPQDMDNRYSSAYGAFRDDWNYTDANEDCLKLNVWTPATDGGKRPVLVWMHGGGYTSGNGIEQSGYHGENLARSGDIVFVSLNHRLGPVGYADFSAVDPAFKYSGNVGVMDLVKALQWVHDNIAAFGGDPDNVTIMGQSGGGSKVCTVLAMPSSEGLVSKVVPLSGNATSAMDQSVSQEIGRRIWQKAGRDMRRLQAMPWKEYLALANAVASDYNDEVGATGLFSRMSFRPVADGEIIPKGDFFADHLDAASAKVPMMLCSTATEFASSMTSQALEDISKEDAIASLTALYGEDKAARAFESIAKVMPEWNPFKVMAFINSGFRSGVVSTALSKHTQGSPVYVSLFDWDSPLFDGRMHNPHCADICFWFRNTDVMLTHTGGGAAPREMSRKMSSALLSFMRTGNPNCDALPSWAAFDPDTRATMVFDDECRVVENLDTEELAILAE